MPLPSTCCWHTMPEETQYWDSPDGPVWPYGASSVPDSLVVQRTLLRRPGALQGRKKAHPKKADIEMVMHEQGWLT